MEGGGGRGHVVSYTSSEPSPCRASGAVMSKPPFKGGLYWVNSGCSRNRFVSMRPQAGNDRCVLRKTNVNLARRRGDTPCRPLWGDLGPEGLIHGRRARVRRGSINCWRRGVRGLPRYCSPAARRASNRWSKSRCSRYSIAACQYCLQSSSRSPGYTAMSHLATRRNSSRLCLASVRQPACA